MENINLFLLRLILTAVVLNVVAAKKAKETTVAQTTQDSSEVSSRDHNQHDHDFYFKPTLEHIDGTARKHMETPMKHGKHNDETPKKHGKKSKKAKRETYGRWSARSLNSGYNSVDYSGSLPLYLVFNRKVGAYYPFYKYPKESQRRSGNYRRVPLD